MLWLLGSIAALVVGIFEFGRISTLYHFFKWGFFIALSVILVQFVLRARDRLKRKPDASAKTDVTVP
jgi:membrane protein implicated in regulation of membrane protease activity